MNHAKKILRLPVKLNEIQLFLKYLSLGDKK